MKTPVRLEYGIVNVELPQAGPHLGVRFATVQRVDQLSSTPVQLKHCYTYMHTYLLTYLVTYLHTYTYNHITFFRQQGLYRMTPRQKKRKRKEIKC